MDRPLDYVVPGTLIDEAEVGRAVRVRVSGPRARGVEQVANGVSVRMACLYLLLADEGNQL